MYLVMAFRGGNPEKHSYVAGVYKDIDEAMSASKNEEYHRGGKYSCVVDEVVPGKEEVSRVYETEAFKMEQIIIKKLLNDKLSNMSYYEDEMDYLKLLQAAINDVPFLTTADQQQAAERTKEKCQQILSTQLDMFMRVAKQNKKISSLTIQ